MISLEHTVEEVNLIIAALRELPHKLVNELLGKIEKQAVPQLQAATASPAATPETSVAE